MLVTCLGASSASPACESYDMTQTCVLFVVVQCIIRTTALLAAAGQLDSVCDVTQMHSTRAWDLAPLHCVHALQHPPQDVQFNCQAGIAGASFCRCHLFARWFDLRVSHCHRLYTARCAYNAVCCTSICLEKQVCSRHLLISHGHTVLLHPQDSHWVAFCWGRQQCRLCWV